MYNINLNDSLSNIEEILNSYRNAVVSKAKGDNIHIILESVGTVNNLCKKFYSNKTDLESWYLMKVNINWLRSVTGVSLDIIY